MEDRIADRICERSDDLVSFLYQELSDGRLAGFKQHLEDCRSCADEVAAFGKIRAGMVAWREQSLGMAPIQTSPAFTRRETPSALAAMRQFFSLSPLWLKGAVAFASIALLASVALLVMNLNAKPQAPLAQSDKKYSETEMKARVEAEIQARLQEQAAAKQNQPANDPERTQVIAQLPTPRLKSTAVNSKTRRAPLSRAEREQLAADLRLISPSEDDLDLLGEQINR